MGNAPLASNPKDAPLALHAALACGQFQLAADLVGEANSRPASRAALDAPGPDGLTPLALALLRAPDDLCALLAESSPDPWGAPGQNPLLSALRKGKERAAASIAARAPDVSGRLDAPDPDSGELPLDIAIGAGMDRAGAAIAERLARSGSPLLDGHGREHPPIFDALDARMELTARALIRAATPEWTTRDGETPLGRACLLGMRDFCLHCAQLAKEGSIPASMLDDAGSDAAAPILLALESGMESVAIALLEAGAHPGVADDDGNGLLASATRASRIDFALAMARRCREDLCDDSFLDVPDEDGVAPILLALEARRPDLAVALMDAGADLNFESPEGDGLLASAIAIGASTRPFVDAFVAGCASDAVDDALLDVPDSEGMPPILLALEQGEEDLAIAIMDAGADLNVEDPEGNGLLAAAFAMGRRSFCRAMAARAQEGSVPDSLLDKPCSEGIEPIWTAMEAGDEDFAIELIEANADLGAEHDGTGLLARAIKFGRRRFALAMAGACSGDGPAQGALDATDADGDAPISMALMAGDEELAIALARAGADLAVQDSEANDVLPTALLRGRTRFVQAVARMVRDGSARADLVDQTDGESIEAILVAVDQGLPGPVVELAYAGAQLHVHDGEGSGLLPNALARVAAGRADCAAWEDACLAIVACCPPGGAALSQSDAEGVCAFESALRRSPAVAQAMLDAGLRLPADLRLSSGEPAAKAALRAGLSAGPNPDAVRALRTRLDPAVSPVDEHPLFKGIAERLAHARRQAAKAAEPAPPRTVAPNRARRR